MSESKKKIINAHMHIFTGDMVPPYLAKTFILWPFYYLFKTQWILGIINWYYRREYRKKYDKYKNKEKKTRQKLKRLRKGRFTRWWANRKSDLRGFWLTKLLLLLIGIWITAIATFFFFELFISLFKLGEGTKDYVLDVIKKLEAWYLYFDFDVWVKVSWLIAVLLLVPRGRQVILFIAKSFVPLIRRLFKKNALGLIDRYLMMAHFSIYKTQKSIAQRALDQLTPGSGIVILPMDMEYMGAGKTKLSKSLLEKKQKLIQEQDWESNDFKDVYRFQLRELWQFTKDSKANGTKDKYYPFVFIDPRRIRFEDDFFRFHVDEDTGKIVLDPCVVKSYIEDRGFAGFKIYPALGYFPFDQYLLPLWKYAAENQIPITSHCIMGTIYYRGKKEKQWNYHPVIKEEVSFNPETEEYSYGKKLLPQIKNKDFQFNFTHPLNYLCMLEEPLLREYMAEIKKEFDTLDSKGGLGDKEKKEKAFKSTLLTHVFGFTNIDTPLKSNLSELKICLAHFGGEEEWNKYLESDRQVYSQRLMRDPEEGIKFLMEDNGEKVISWHKINQVWRADWYSIICSLMIRYPNVYADLSYIISKESIYPLLKYTLEKGENYEEEHKQYLAEKDIHHKAAYYTGKNKLRSRILWGTDFYVVRNHKSDKDLFIETKALLEEENFDLIARENPHNFLAKRKK